jgi:secernin
MGGDMVVALGRATVDRHTHFGHNSCHLARELLTIHGAKGRSFALGEQLALRRVTLSQARQTYTTVGVQSKGAWGYHHGVNGHGVAIGRTPLRTRMPGDGPGLLGVELARLALERSRSARQALDLLGDLISRHGTGGGPEPDGCDSAFLVVDAREAFVVETAGLYWVYQEVREVRAVSDVSTVRQDWDGIAHGLASLAIERGWWQGDGSKLDFAGAVAEDVGWISNPSHESGPSLRRWGRATLLLEQQNGHIDSGCIRRLLSDHYEGCADELDPLVSTPPPGPRSLCPHGEGGTATSLIVALDPLVPELQYGNEGMMPIVWCCPGPPCMGVYLPVLLDGELPDALGPSGAVHASMAKLIEHIDDDRELWQRAEAVSSRLQTQLDQETGEFLEEAARSGSQPSPAERQRRSSLFMQHVAEEFVELIQGLLRQRAARAVAGNRPRAVAANSPMTTVGQNRDR